MGFLIFKHWLCDFVLQSDWMARVKARPKGWQVALLVHAFINGLGTFVLFAIWFGVDFGLVFGGFDLALHFLIDKMKVELSRGLTPDKHKFWVLLGLDQSIHYFVLYSLYTMAINLRGF